MQLFYSPDLTPETSHYTFSKEESRHIVRVLRKKENDILHITNGKGYIFSAKVMLADQKNCIVEVTSFEFQKSKNYEEFIFEHPRRLK